MKTNKDYKIKELERLNKYLAYECNQKASQIETLMQEIQQLKTTNLDYTRLLAQGKGKSE
jgi:hypothetical protein